MPLLQLVVICTLVVLCSLAEADRVFKESQSGPGTSIEYRKTSICETTPNVPSYAGYVHLTSPSIRDLQGSQPFNVSTFFWYFSARRNASTAPLVLYLAGGPGQSSTYSALTENGPCYALANGNSTMLNPFSFNDRVNVLYVDQPNQVGFSHDEVVEGVLDVLDGSILPGPAEESTTRIAGKFASQKPEATVNTTALAAKTMWYFLQTWLAEFEEYHGPKNTLKIWGHSYGGAFAASLATHVLHQNARISNGTLPCTRYRPIHVPAIGFTNGFLDLEAQVMSYATYAYNNTYGFQIYDDATYNHVLDSITRSGGCVDGIHKCRAAKAQFDPDDIGNDLTANAICAEVGKFCFENVLGPFYALANVSEFDIAAPKANPYPPMWAANFLNQPWVRKELGVPDGLNFTLVSKTVKNNFLATADMVRYEGGQDLTFLLNEGVQVAMVYGDRDWKCSWLGAQNLTLSLPWTSHGPFAAAPYINLTLSPPSQLRTTAIVRQHTLLSFARVFQSGHSPSWYSPLTTQTVFTRAMLGKDIPWGVHDTEDFVRYEEQRLPGWWEELPTGTVETQCSLWNTGTSCTEAQKQALANGTAKVVDWRVVSPS